VKACHKFDVNMFRPNTVLFLQIELKLKADICFG